MHKTPELFDQRNEQKKMLEFFSTVKTHARIGEFWRYWEGVNLGNEISKDGKFMRVCMVLQNDMGNGLYLVAPITTKYHKRMEKYYVKVNNFEKYGLRECWIILNQIKIIDSKRLINMTGVYKSYTALVPIVMNKYISLIQKNHPIRKVGGNDSTRL